MKSDIACLKSPVTTRGVGYRGNLLTAVLPQIKKKKLFP